ncbi:MAG TPA: hypothetical protein VK960_04690 [Acidimicrobiia bacterium]|nr:hypothetical protein [Acidimicrobiia bacterium]
MRGATVLVAVTLLVGCGNDPATTATALTDASTTVATTAATTTTTPGPVILPASRIAPLEPGVEYRAPSFWSPLSLAPAREGWRANGSSELWIYFQYFESGRSTYDLDLAIVAHSPNAEIAGVARRITNDEQVTSTAGPTPAMLDGHDAVVLDIEVEASRFGGGYCGNPTAGNSRFQNNETGMVLLEDSDSPLYPHFFGVRSCRGARIWVVDVAGATITIIAATERPEMLEDLLPVAEALVATIDFDD